MAKKKKVLTTVKLQLKAGEAGAGPPVATALGPHGVPLMDFVRQYNDQTSNQKGMVVPVVVTVYDDRTFEFILKTPPASVLIRQAAGLEKGSPEPNRNKVGSITEDQLRQIAETKMVDLNANDIDQAKKIIAGTARSMGVTVQ